MFGNCHMKPKGYGPLGQLCEMPPNTILLLAAFPQQVLRVYGLPLCYCRNNKINKALGRTLSTGMGFSSSLHALHPNLKMSLTNEHVFYFLTRKRQECTKAPALIVSSDRTGRGTCSFVHGNMHMSTSMSQTGGPMYH
jgi:hypothetical protein